ncbi:putative exported protein [Halobacteriovorax marinus SJ]|uniref:Exported protein n=1 Tax=Halobacteriovorax marinus (strain ATCC BAA-682 / DSM 15412 / SJ) TaxID=862908 RepID=E1WXA4_HALMS|nr:hypothetical protein [Halobacteriovorax marinus]CBW25805.1 putative exported protein [Halobacteriovorax marinus SJ]
MFKILSLLLLTTATSWAADNGGLKISAAADMLYEQGINKSSTAKEKLEMRSAELTFYAPIDHNFNGVISVASHDHEGSNNFELHELYIENTSLIPRSTFKVGKFFLGIGRLNRFHRHDWFFTNAPIVNENFFAEEAAFDSGIEYNYLLPTEAIFNLTLGLTIGDDFSHEHDHDEDDAGHDHDSEKAKYPTHYLRFSHFKEFSATKGMETGINFLRKKNAHGEEQLFAGIDYLLKNRVGKTNTFILQSEIWFRESEEDHVKTEELGAYLFNEYSVFESSALGVRLDFLKNLTSSNDQVDYGITGQYTYNSSEFAKIRTSVTHEFSRHFANTVSKDTKAMLQLVFILGSHPAHVF